MGEITDRLIKEKRLNQPQSVFSTEVGKSKYDVGYNPALEGQLASLNEFRAQNQSAATKLALGVPRLITRAVTSVAEGITSTAGLVAWAVASREDSTFDQFVNNKFTQVIQSADEATKEFFQVYTPEAVANGNIWANVTSASFWGTDVADGVGFMLGMALPGVGFGKLAAGVKVMRGINKGFAAVGSATKVGKVAANNVDLAITTAYQTASEAAFEAGALTSGLRQRRTDAQNVLASGGTLTEEEERFANLTDSDIGTSGLRAFVGNTLVLAGPNLLMNKWLIGRFRTGSPATKLGKDLKAIQAGTYKAPTRLQKAGSMAGSLGKGIASEGFFEEGLQMAMEEAEMSGKNSLNLGSVISTYIDNLSSVDTQKGIFIGALLGGTMSAYGDYKSGKTDETNKQKVLRALATDMGTYSAALNFTEADLNSDQSPKLDKEGKVIIDEAKAAIKAQVLIQKANMLEAGQNIGDASWIQLMDVSTLQSMASAFSKIPGGLELFKEKLSESMTSGEISLAGKLGLPANATQAQQLEKAVEIAQTTEKAADVAALYSGSNGFYTSKDANSEKIFDSMVVPALENQLAMRGNFESILKANSLELMRLEVENRPENATKMKSLTESMKEIENTLDALDKNIATAVDGKTVQEQYDAFYEKQYSKIKDVRDKAAKAYEEAKKGYKEGNTIEVTDAQGNVIKGKLKKRGKEWVAEVEGQDVELGKFYAGVEQGTVKSIRSYPEATAKTEEKKPPVDFDTVLGAEPAEVPAITSVTLEASEATQHEEDSSNKKPSIFASAGLDILFEKVSSIGNRAAKYYNKYVNGRPAFNTADNQQTFFSWATKVVNGSMNDTNFEFRAFILESNDPLAAELFSENTPFNKTQGRGTDGKITSPADLNVKIVAFRNGEPVRENGVLVYTSLHSIDFSGKTLSSEQEEQAYFEWKKEIVSSLLKGEQISLKPVAKSAGHAVYEQPAISGSSAKRMRFELSGRVYPKGKQTNLKLYIGKALVKGAQAIINLGTSAINVGVSGAVYTTIPGANGGLLPVRLMTSTLTAAQARTVAGLIYYAFPSDESGAKATLKFGDKTVRILSDKTTVGMLARIVSIGEGKSVFIAKGVLYLSTGYSVKISEIPGKHAEVIKELSKLNFNVSEALINKTVEMPVFNEVFFNTFDVTGMTKEQIAVRQSQERNNLTFEKVKYNSYLDSSGILKTDLVPDTERQIAHVYWTFDVGMLNVQAPRAEPKLDVAPSAAIQVDNEMSRMEADYSGASSSVNEPSDDDIFAALDQPAASAVSDNIVVEVTEAGVDPEMAAMEAGFIETTPPPAVVAPSITISALEDAQEAPEIVVPMSAPSKVRAKGYDPNKAPAIRRTVRRTSAAIIRAELGKMGISSEQIEAYEKKYGLIKAGDSVEDVQSSINAMQIAPYISKADVEQVAEAESITQEEAKKVIVSRVTAFSAGLKNSLDGLTEVTKAIIAKIAKAFMVVGIVFSMAFTTNLKSSQLEPMSRYNISAMETILNVSFSEDAVQVIQMNIESNETYFLVDKPTATAYVMQGSTILEKLPVVLGKNLEDNISPDYSVGNVGFTKAGKFTMRDLDFATDPGFSKNPNSPTYSSKILRFNGAGGQSFHVNAGASRDAAVKTSTDTDNRMTAGCISTSKELFESKILPHFNKGAVDIFVTRDFQEGSFSGFIEVDKVAAQIMKENC